MIRKKTKTKAPKTTTPEVQTPAPEQREWIARDADLHILGQVNAANESEALATAKEQFDGAETVEPTLADQDIGVQAPALEEPSAEQPATETPVEQATPDAPAEPVEVPAAAPPATPDETSDAPRILTREELGLPMPSAGKNQDAPPPASEGGATATATDGAAPPAKKKRTRAAKPAAPTEKKLSALDAAAKVLAETGTAMSCQELILAMAEKGYWSSPAGKTPAATLYSALLRETQTKGSSSRFVKADRGKFALRASE